MGTYVPKKRGVRMGAYVPHVSSLPVSRPYSHLPVSEEQLVTSLVQLQPVNLAVVADSTNSVATHKVHYSGKR